jgi:hypothetical protein
VPVWHEATKDWVREGRLVVLGVVQEQHAERARLFAQWQGLDWPILHDPINLMQSTAVPIFVAIDEGGTIRSVGPDLATFERDFLDQAWMGRQTNRLAPPGRPDIEKLKQQAEQEGSSLSWRGVGDALSLWSAAVSDAVAAYSRAVDLDPDDADARFRLGVSFRMRYESESRRPGDFRAAVQAWGEALERRPNQYIWRRRIQQYGPRLDKPYPFYDWVDEARQAVLARGEEPIELPVPPSGAEVAAPATEFERETEDQRSPDASGRIVRDPGPLVHAEVVTVPGRVRPGETARIHISFHPDERRRVHWNNESEPLRLWLDAPEGWQLSRRLLTAPLGAAPETREVRRLEFEIQVPSDASGSMTLSAYALYYVCEDAGGTCLFLRQDIPVRIEVASDG